jgi:7-cyano-7-deazaguanine synthase
MRKDAAIVLFSGGQDSTVCLFWALENFATVEALCFRYGQRHSTEIEAAEKIANQVSVPFHLLDVSSIVNLSVNSLTDSTINISETAGLPNTFVPGRNLFFINIAAVVAREKKIANIVIGVSQTDYSGYPDCRNEFILSAGETINLAMDEKFVIHTPLMWLYKSEIWKLAEELNIFDIIKNKTVTCYNGILGDGCGDCPSCKLRKSGLERFLGQRV